MGNLRIAYHHNLLGDWLGDDGDIVDFRRELRGLNMKGDVLTCSATPTGESELDGTRCSTLELSVKNQEDDVETCPDSATVVHFEGRQGRHARRARAVAAVRGGGPGHVPHPGDDRQDRLRVAGRGRRR